MSGLVSYQVSPQSDNQIETSASIISAPATSASISSPGLGSAGKRKRMSKSKASPTLKRAASTPQMGSIGPPDPGGLSPSALDKRRNKLGYQRISIACGHCRRRKIRCVMQESDDQGRCQNCIRLKKECVFYPVDATGGTESRAQSKTAGSKPSSVMSNSPSERLPGSHMDHDHDLSHFPHLASNAPPDFAAMEAASGLGISGRAPIGHADFGYSQGLSDRQNWHPGVYSNTNIAHADPAGTSPWRFQESPRMGDFAAFPTTTDGAANHGYPTYPYPHPRGDFGMHPPMRSMSYGNVEPAMHSFQGPPSANPADYMRSSSSTHYPPPAFELRSTPSTSSMAEPNFAPVTSDSMPQYGMYTPSWGYHHGHPQTMGMDFPRHDSVNAQWYQSSHLDHGLDDPHHGHHTPHTSSHPLSQPPLDGYGKGPGQ